MGRIVQSGAGCREEEASHWVPGDSVLPWPPSRLTLLPAHHGGLTRVKLKAEILLFKLLLSWS